MLPLTDFEPGTHARFCKCNPCSVVTTSACVFVQERVLSLTSLQNILQHDVTAKEKKQPYELSRRYIAGVAQCSSPTSLVRLAQDTFNNVRVQETKYFI
jgi:hypothetical protein